jgi:hypothetical protein
MTYFFPIFGAYEILDYDGTIKDTVVFGGSTWGVDLGVFTKWVDTDPTYWYPQTIA